VFAFKANSQSVFWSENFSVQGSICDPTDPVYGWTLTNIDTQGTFANHWYIFYPVNCLRSDSCNSANSNTNEGSLYISYGSICDSAINGAVYRAGCDNATHKQIESPLIDCTGKTNIVLNFDFIAAVYYRGDYGSVLYSDDGGANWITLQALLNSGHCPLNNHLAFWKSIQISLPPSAENNPNVKIAFDWRNNADCYGKLFSFAIDNIELTSQCQIDLTVIQNGDPFYELCAGHDYHHTVSPSNPAYTYTWEVNGNDYIYGPDFNYTFEYTGNYAVHLTVTDTNGCVDHLDTTLVAGGFDVSLSLDPDTICPNQCIKFDSSVNPVGSYTYSWSLPAGTPSTSTNSGPTSCYTQIGNHTATLTVSDPTNTTCSRTESIPFFVDTCGYPIVTLINNNLMKQCVCVGTCLDFTSNAYDATSYSWIFPTGDPGTSSSASPTNICFDTAGTFDIELTVTNSIGSSSVFQSFTVSEYPPTPLLTYDAGTHSITVSNHNSSYLYELFVFVSSTWVSLGYVNTNPIAIDTYFGYLYKVKASASCQECSTESDSIFVPVDN